MPKRSSLFLAYPLAVLSLAAQPLAWRVNTLAGNYATGNGGPAINAVLARPRQMVYDRNGNLYIADTDNHQVRRINRDGRIVAIAGTGVQGSSGDGGPALQATLNLPRGLALSGDLLYIAENGNLRIRVVNLLTGTIEAFAGSGVAGFAGDGEPAGNARFRSLYSLAVDNQGNLLAVDRLDHRVRRINRQTGIITTFAGNGTRGTATDGSPANTSALNFPEAVAVDAAGNAYIGNWGNGRVYRVDGAGNIRHFAGSLSSINITDGVPATGALMISPIGLAVDNTRRVLYVSDYDLCTVRSVGLENGIIDTVAGDALRPCGFSGDGSGGRSALLAGPYGLAVEATGALAIGDIDAYRIRRLSPTGTIETIAGRQPFGGDGGPARDALLFLPYRAISDGAGGQLVVDSGNCVIRRVSPAGVISTFAGRPGICSGAANSDGPKTSATFSSSLNGLARDRRGNVYVTEGPRLRRIDVETERVTSLARNLSAPSGIALDPAEENLYVAESNGNRITRIALATGAASVFAGSTGGQAGFAGDGDFAPNARFFSPTEVAVDRQGNVFVCDFFNSRIRRIDIVTQRVSTVAGNGSDEPADSGLATAAGLPFPTGLAIDADGVLYTTSRNRVLRIAGGSLQSIAGRAGGFGLEGDGGLGPNAVFAAPVTVSVDGPRLLIADLFNHRIRTLTPERAAALVQISGNNQAAGTGSAIPNPLVVQVRLTDGSPVPGVPVTFAISAGTLNPPGPVLTGADGNASVRAVMPAGAGPVTVTATVAGLPPVTFSLTATPTVTVTPPRVTSVITAGAFGAAPRIAPGAWIEIYGTNLARETRQWAGDDFINGVAPTQLAGVRVLINDRPAFVQLVSPTQINALAPDGIGTGRVNAQVITADGPSAAFQVEAAGRAPALLAPPAFASGGTQFVAATFPDGVFVGPENLIAGAAFRPATAGERVLMYGVGFGATVPAIPAGLIAGQATTLPNLRVRIGGRDALLEYGGLAGGFVGLYQFNVVIPEGVTPGNAALEVTVDGVAVAQSLALAIR